MPGVDTVKLACPNCGDIYTPPSSKYAGLDGGFFLLQQAVSLPVLNFDDLARAEVCESGPLKLDKENC